MKKRVDFTLQYETYKKIGEVKGALATYAENIYKTLSDKEKVELRQIFLQLVQPSQGTEDTCRIALLEELLTHSQFREESQVMEMSFI